MPDFQIVPWHFNDTTITVECASEAAKNRTDGAVSMQISTSSVIDFCDRMMAEGFKVDWKRGVSA
jgi:hypothetical protein